MKLNRILLVTDGSDDSEKGDDLAIGLAALAGAEVVVMCSFDGPHGIRRRGAAMAEELRKSIEDEAREILQEVAAKVQAAGLAVRAFALEGSPPVTIAQLAADVEPDLIVLAAGRTGGIPGLLWGSVAEIIRTSTFPVLVSR